MPESLAALCSELRARIKGGGVRFPVTERLLDAAEQNARLIALLQGVLVASDAQMDQVREDIAKELKS